MNRGTNWKRETLNAAGIAVRVILRFFSYIANVIITVLLIGLITGLVVGSTFVYYVKNYIDADIDEFDMINTGQNMTTKIYYMDWTDRESRTGTAVEIDDQRLYGPENRMWVSIQRIPDNLQKAFVAVEDKRFWEHNGVDFLRSASAAVNYFFKGVNSYGASTITQQLVKNVTGDDEVTVQRKIQEIMRAMKLSEQKDRSEILEMYLNIVPLSQGCYGVQAAAYTYFGKDVSELSLIECAAIASITQAPTKWDPIQNPDNNKRRRDTVLSLMLEQGYITQREFDGAFDKELVLSVHSEDNPTVTSVNTWYTDAVINETIDLLIEKKGYTREVASKLIYTAGYKIITAMDPRVQSVLDEYFADDSNFAAVDTSPIQPQASMVIIDHSNGDVLGIAGGRGVKEGNRIQNYATQTKRSPGSSIKPLSVYGPAFEYGVINYASVFDDTPINFGDPVYDTATGALAGYSNPHGYPSNYPDTYKGLTPVSDAVRRSVNTISLKVLEKLTLEESFDFVKNKLHMDSFIDYRELTGGVGITDMDYSALGLGGMNYGVTVLEMTAAYQIFPNKGVYNKPRMVLKILDSEDNVVVENDADSHIVLSDQNASILTKLMQNVVESGTATAVTLDTMVNVAGKTGTTTKDNDRWFMGYTPYYVGGVWFGYDMPRSLSSFSATASPAITIWDEVMTILHKEIIEEAKATGYGIESFVLANGVVTATYCRDSGKLIGEACKADPRGSRAETGYFTFDTVPTETCDRHVLVDFDKVTAGVAGKGCPPENIKKYGLIKVDDRRFPVPGIIVVDAQYVYRDLPGHIEPGLNGTDPFFINTLPDKTYVGVSSYDLQFNRYCAAHHNIEPEIPEEEIPELPEEQIPGEIPEEQETDAPIPEELIVP
ncbi:MAG: transglycosylase domain-containing protein [Eubacteriales bacterium]|nr:transglycosylase domain-containing protein [Eubacteriales bacterium]